MIADDDRAGISGRVEVSPEDIPRVMGVANRKDAAGDTRIGNPSVVRDREHPCVKTIQHEDIDWSDEAWAEHHASIARVDETVR